VIAQAVLEVGTLPAAPLDAAASFHRDVVPAIRANSAVPALALVFPPAGHDHQAWRLAAVQGLARELAPDRVNGIVGRDEAAIAETAAFLAHAPGITGQLLEVDGNSAAKG
jgi:hypothetical protein